LWPESLEEHLPASIAGVLRLRAVNPSLCDESARRFAQDGDFVEGRKPRYEQAGISLSIRCWEGETADPPDFLLNLVALADFMRLSLQKGAHAALSCAAWQEIRVRSG
jgi:hypothetical protein